MPLLSPQPERAPVLGLFAHPDDETFGPGGTLARLAAEGHPVHLWCATRGEAGTIGASASLGRERLAALRRRELKEACRCLGLRPPVILDLPDGGLAGLGEEALLRPFLRALREVRPSLVVTFHANGLSGHPDHRTVTARARTAFDRAAEGAFAPELGAPHEAARLWTYAIVESRARRVDYRRLHAVPDDAVDAAVDIRSFTGAKRAAVAAHASQKPFMDRLEEHVGDLDEFWTPEAFVLEAARTPLPAGGGRPVADLFAGMGRDAPGAGEGPRS